MASMSPVKTADLHQTLCRRLPPQRSGLLLVLTPCQLLAESLAPARLLPEPQGLPHVVALQLLPVQALLLLSQQLYAQPEQQIQI